LGNSNRPEKASRLLVASLHQAVAERLPTRLEFYEHWLDTHKLRHDSNAPARVMAALSFLRREDSEYDHVMTLAGRFAVDWEIESWPGLLTGILRGLPVFARRWIVVRLAARLLRRLGVAHRLKVRWHRDLVEAEVMESVFCDVRATSTTPLCVFHAAAITRFLDQFGLGVSVDLKTCRVVAGDACCMVIDMRTNH